MASSSSPKPSPTTPAKTIEEFWKNYNLEALIGLSANIIKRVAPDLDAVLAYQNGGSDAFSKVLDVALSTPRTTLLTRAIEAEKKLRADLETKATPPGGAPLVSLDPSSTVSPTTPAKTIEEFWKNYNLEALIGLSANIIKRVAPDLDAVLAYQNGGVDAFSRRLDGAILLAKRTLLTRAIEAEKKLRADLENQEKKATTSGAGTTGLFSTAGTGGGAGVGTGVSSPSPAKKH